MALPSEPHTREEMYLNSIANSSGTIPLEPHTRVEMYLNNIATGEGALPSEPHTRTEMYLDYIAKNGGGSSVEVEAINITQNGTTTAPSGKAYSPVTVNVPNSYAAGDEGKVVQNGALVAQTPMESNITENGVYNTTNNNSVEVVVDRGWIGSTMIFGTLDNPWGNYDFAGVAEAISGFSNSLGNAFMCIGIDASAIGAGGSTAALVAGYGQIRAVMSLIPSTTIADAYVADIAWDANGLDYAHMLQNGTITDLAPYASLIETVIFLPLDN